MSHESAFLLPSPKPRMTHRNRATSYHLLRDDQDYRELGGNYFDELDRQAVRKRPVRRLERLGYEVRLEAPDPAL